MPLILTCQPGIAWNTNHIWLKHNLSQKSFKNASYDNLLPSFGWVICFDNCFSGWHCLVDWLLFSWATKCVAFVSYRLILQAAKFDILFLFWSQCWAIRSDILSDPQFLIWSDLIRSDQMRFWTVWSDDYLIKLDMLVFIIHKFIFIVFLVTFPSIRHTNRLSWSVCSLSLLQKTRTTTINWHT